MKTNEENNPQRTDREINAIREITGRISRQMSELIGTDENTARILIKKELEFLVTVVKDIYGIRPKRQRAQELLSTKKEENKYE